MKDLILALDCSLRWTNVSVFAGDRCVSQRLDMGRRQAAELPLVVERALKEANSALSDIGLVAVTNGPGYFTGIRVGASYAAALAYGLDVKIASICTLYMLAYPFILQSQPVLVLVYAGRRRVYAASFGCAQDTLPVGEYGGDQLDDWLQKNPGQKNLLFVSDDPPKAIEASGLSREVLQVLPDASIVARIARRAQKPAAPAHFSIVLPMELKIFYHRNPQIG